MPDPTLPRRAFAEALGTALLLAAVVGSGIMAEKLAGGNAAVALLANALATGGALVALIHTFGPISGAQFNPAVTLALICAGKFPGRDALPYILAQTAGAIAGVWLAHLMFGLPILQASTHGRTSVGEWVGEITATFGLIGLIFSMLRHNATAIPFAVAAYIVGAYWFTSSTSFANPAVTLARGFSDTFAGILPVHVPGFVLAQLLGAGAAVVVFRWLLGPDESA